MMLRKREFSCKRDGLVIRGVEYRTQEKKQPAVIISHGFMANFRSVEKYARELAVMGYVTYCFDFNGGCIRGKSDGKTTEMSVLTEVEDLIAVINYVKTLPYVSPAQITLMGCSQGGFVSALTAVKLNNQIEKLILFYPALCIPDDARQGKMMMAKFDPSNIPTQIKCGPMRLGRRYAADVLDMNPFDAISPYDGPVLIIHGSKDKIVDVSYAHKAREAYNQNSIKCELAVLEGAGHGFKAKENAVAMQIVQEFLRGRRNVLTTDVELLGCYLKRQGLNNILTLPFAGTAESQYFQGRIMPGAEGVQFRKLWKTIRFRAKYTLEGTDSSGKNCKIHIHNVYEENRWKPTVITDSEMLGFLNGAECTSILHHRKKGPVVRIYCELTKTRNSPK